MKVPIYRRLFKAYKAISRTFGIYLSPLITGLLLLLLRIIVQLGMFLDYIFFPSLINKKIKNPIIIVGNPRSGTTFLHRYLVSNHIGAGSQLWQLIYTSALLQKIIKPILPFLERFSPTKHHSTEAHKTSLNSVETDDASMLFRFFDGFFLYGFILSWLEEDLFDWVDPQRRDNSKRDFKWFESIWKRNLILHKQDRIIAKLFSISANTPAFQNRFTDSKILYMVRDPLSVIPSGLSLVTGVLDKKFGFWSMPKEKRQHFINRLYNALKELLLRFHDDWTAGKIDKNKVLIVRFDEMMGDFDGLMDKILKFVDYKPSDDFVNDIKETSKKQKEFKSNHKYDLEKFGLTEEQIKKDCEKIYKTFLT